MRFDLRQDQSRCSADFILCRIRHPQLKTGHRPALQCRPNLGGKRFRFESGRADQIQLRRNRVGHALP